MKKKNVLPHGNRDLANWANNFATMPSDCCGITEADLAGFRASADDYNTKVSKADAAQISAKQAVVAKQSSRRRLEELVRPLIRRVKAHPNYNEEIGAMLGIEGSVSTYDLTNAAPTLTARDKTDGTVELRFARHGSDGVNIYYQLEQDIKWTLVGRAMTSPFQDIRPLQTPGKLEIRRYTAVYTQKTTEVGRFSEDVIVTCVP